MSVTNNGGLSPSYSYYNRDGLKERTVQGMIDFRYEYDSLGRLQRKILPSGGVISYGYDKGELVRSIASSCLTCTSIASWFTAGTKFDGSQWSDVRICL